MKNKLDKWIMHNIECERYGNITLEKVLAYLATLYEDVNNLIISSGYVSTQRKLTQLSDEIEVLLLKYEKDVKKYLYQNCAEIVEKESNWVVDFMKEVGKTFVIPATILSAVRLSPIAKASDIESMVFGSTYRIRQTISNSLKTAYLTKESTDDVVERLEERFESLENGITSDIDTYNTTMHRTTDYIMFKKNSQKVIYSAALDSVTCIECLSYNGTEFDADKALILPLHNRCRCAFVPADIVEDKIPTFSEWVDTLSDSEQKDVLGKSRYELFKSGIPVTSFYKDNKSLTLKQIKESVSNR